MEKYDLARTARLFPKFVDNLSNWYIRRSRKRFWKSENDNDKDFAYQTLYHVLVELSKLMAPFAPFMSEEIYRNLTGEKSVHLADFPIADENLIDTKINESMSDMREIISIGLQERAKAKIKVRQPLGSVILGKKFTDTFDELLNGDTAFWNSILEEELNVKGAKLDHTIEMVSLDTEITEDLRQEGIAREIIRFIQEMRKEAGFDVENHIEIFHDEKLGIFEKLGDMIARETLADNVIARYDEGTNFSKKFDVDGNSFHISIKKQ
jgi:isoleucyl-tRNA synthetase